MDVGFIDTTFRDGSQSLWALGMRTGMIEAVAEAMDQAGFEAVEVPVVAINIKKFVRDLKEDPWDMMRMVAKKMPNTVKGCMAGGHILSFEAPPPPELVEFFFTTIVATGALNRAQLTSNTFDQTTRNFPWIIPHFRKLGLQIALALSYTVSPRHTDQYYAEKTRELVAFKPDAIYLKDQGGLLTLDRIRTLLPVIVQNANGVPVELHSHCTTGLADLVYLEALQLGVRTLHSAIPPLANGSSQPSVLNLARNAKMSGHRTNFDEEIVRRVSDKLTAVAKQDKLPIGAPLEYDCAQYIHQVPGGVISNLRHQLAQLGIQHRLNDVLEEVVEVRKDLGYPIMITPHSQFVVTQAAINVAMGERYKLVTDEIIQFAQGLYGDDSGYTWMDPNFRDRILGLPRAKELAVRERPDLSLKDIRNKLGGAGVSDEEFLTRYIMKGEKEIESMRAAGPPRQYFNTSMPLLTLIQELEKHKGVRYVRVQKGNASVVVQNSSSA
jgi:oxaloacetate decarboxylase (Na+ extruding) subunit alpha